jgi:phytoene dehydrogenase-like protein
MLAEQQIRIDLVHGETGFSLTVAPLGALPQSPPVQTERFAIYYGHAKPSGVELPRGGVRAVLHGIKRRIAEHEGSVDLRESF